MITTKILPLYENYNLDIKVAFFSDDESTYDIELVYPIQVDINVLTYKNQAISIDYPFMILCDIKKLNNTGKVVGRYNNYWVPFRMNKSS
jgi:hypothetical protein